MEDDNREVDWAARQIDKLSSAVMRLESRERSTRTLERITALEHGTRLIETGNDWERRLTSVEEVLANPALVESVQATLALQNRRIAALELQIGNIEDRVGDIEGRSVFMKTHVELQDRVKVLEAGIASLSQQSNVDRDAINRLMTMVSGRDDRIKTMVREQEEDVVAMNERVIRLEKAMADHASETVKAVWSATIRELDMGGELPPNADLSKSFLDRRDENEKLVTGRRETYQRGLAIGAAKAIENAERRVKGYMAEHFSTATIEGVLTVLRGSVPVEGNPMGQWNQGYSKGRQSTIELVNGAMKRAGCSLSQRESVERQLRDRV